MESARTNYLEVLGNSKSMVEAAGIEPAAADRKALESNVNRISSMWRQLPRAFRQSRKRHTAGTESRNAQPSVGSCKSFLGSAAYLITKMSYSIW